MCWCTDVNIILPCVSFYRCCLYMHFFCMVSAVFYFCMHCVTLSLFSGVLVKTEADPLAELQWAAADQSATQRREGTVLRFSDSHSTFECVFSVHRWQFVSWLSLVCAFQYDSDGSDSQESSEEAELRRKKIEALKVSLLWKIMPHLDDDKNNKTERQDCGDYLNLWFVVLVVSMRV